MDKKNHLTNRTAGQFPSLNRRVVRTVVAEPQPRLADFLATRFTYHSLEKWEELVRGGLITVNNAKVAPDHPLAAGDAVEYLANHIPEPEVPCDVKVIFKSSSLLAIAKPGGLPVHPAGPFYKHTLWFLLKKEFGDIYLINRLDRETSGLVLAAFSAEAAAYYSRQLPKIAKRYLAIVHGRVPGELCAEGYIGLDSASAVRKKRRFSFSPFENSQRAVTHLKPLAFKEEHGGLTLLQATISTGRTHQIRATLHSLGFPVAGDKLYGLDENLYLHIKQGLTPEELAVLIYPHQALHSWRAQVRLLEGGEQSLEAEPPEFYASFSGRSGILSENSDM